MFRHHHLCADAAEQESRAGLELHHQYRQGHCAAYAAWHAGRARIHHLSRNDGHRFARECWKNFRLAAREQISTSRFRRSAKTPAIPESHVAEIPKVVGGYTPECLKRALELYGRAIKNLVPVASCRVAEAAKLLENIFRAINIAMVNELKVVYAAMGIDIWEVIDAAKTKPFGFMPFYPGPGLGGHCIPIDPFYLTWKAREYGQHTRFIELAGEINTAMPVYVINRVNEALASTQKNLSGSHVLMLGIAYKANVDDDRESPSYVLWELLQAKGAHVVYHDPHVPVIRPLREHAHFAGQRSVPLTPDTIAAADVVLLVTHHDAVDYPLVARHARLVVDTRNAPDGLLHGSAHYFKARKRLSPARRTLWTSWRHQLMSFPLAQLLDIVRPFFIASRPSHEKNLRRPCRPCQLWPPEACHARPAGPF